IAHLKPWQAVRYPCRTTRASPTSTSGGLRRRGPWIPPTRRTRHTASACPRLLQGGRELCPGAAVEELAGVLLAPAGHQRPARAGGGVGVAVRVDPGAWPGRVGAGCPLAPLLEEERHPCAAALVAQVACPVWVHRPGVRPGLATGDDPVDAGLSTGR